jgi:hypothetical protein
MNLKSGKDLPQSPKLLPKKCKISFPAFDRFQIAICVKRIKVLTRVQEVQDHAKGSSESPSSENDRGMILGDFTR